MAWYTVQPSDGSLYDIFARFYPADATNPTVWEDFRAKYRQDNPYILENKIFVGAQLNFRDLQSDPSRGLAATKSLALQSMLNTLGGLESRNNYQNINEFGFIGKYQFGEALLHDLGYYNDTAYNPNDWIGTWTGKDGISTRSEFLANESNVQETAIRAAFGKNIGYLTTLLAQSGKTIESYVGTTRTIDGKSVSLTLSGIIAGAHLRGAVNMSNFLLNGTISVDEKGTSIVEYINVFGGFQISYSKDQSGNYTIGDAGGTSTPVDVNGSFATADPLGTVPTFVTNANINSAPTLPLRRTGAIGSTENHGVDRDDYYKVTLSGNASLAASLSELSGDAGLALYDGSFNRLAFANQTGAGADTIRQALNAGTYYLRVYQNTQAPTNYKLAAIAHSGDQSGFANPANLGTFSGDPLTMGGAIGVVNENDFFRFQVGSSFTGSSLSIRLLNLSSNADILIYDSAFEFLGKSTNAGTTAESFVLNRAAGLKAGDTYYAQVNPLGAVTPSYTVQVSG